MEVGQARVLGTLAGQDSTFCELLDGSHFVRSADAGRPDQCAVRDDAAWRAIRIASHGQSALLHRRHCRARRRRFPCRPKRSGRGPRALAVAVSRLHHGTQRQVLRGRDGVLVTRVEIWRFVLQQVAEILGLRDSGHGLLLGGEFLDVGSDHRTVFRVLAGSCIGGDTRGNFGLVGTGVEQGAAHLRFREACCEEFAVCWDWPAIRHISAMAELGRARWRRTAPVRLGRQASVADRCRSAAGRPVGRCRPDGSGFRGRLWGRSWCSPG